MIIKYQYIPFINTFNNNFVPIMGSSYLTWFFRRWGPFWTVSRLMRNFPCRAKQPWMSPTNIDLTGRFRSSQALDRKNDRKNDEQIGFHPSNDEQGLKWLKHRHLKWFMLCYSVDDWLILAGSPFIATKWGYTVVIRLDNLVISIVMFSLVALVWSSHTANNISHLRYGPVHE